MKDPETLLRAAAALRELQVPFALTVAGEDLTGGAARRMARELGVDARFTGHLPQPELRELMLDADLLLVTSRHEAGPLVALEAALCGVPTVGTRVGHLADLEPDAARVVDPGNWRALAEAAAACLRDDSLRQALATRAQAWAITNDADRGAARTLELYQEMI